MQERLNDTRERISNLEHELATAQPDADGGHAGWPGNSPAWIGQATDAVRIAYTSWSAQRIAEQQGARREAAVRVAIALNPLEPERLEAWRRHDAGPTPAGPSYGIGR